MDDPAGRLRVAILHYSAAPVVGGVERVIDAHAALLAEDGHAVTIVAGRGAAGHRGAAFRRVPLADSAHARILALRGQLDRGSVPDGFEATVRALLSDLRSVLAGHDIVIAHNVCSLPVNLVLTAALRRLLDLPEAPRLVAWHHDVAATQERYRAVLHDGSPWDLLRTPWPGVAHVAVSETRRGELARVLALPGSALRVVPNGIDVVAQLALDPGSEAILEQRGILEADPLLLLPSRITPRKNIGLALEVVAHLRRAGHPAVLIVTGPVDPHDPAQRGHLERLLARRAELGLGEAVRFLAAEEGLPVTDRVMNDLYRIADALFLPSREEGFGLPILEAAVHRLPIVCSDLPVLREVAGEGATYVPPDADPGSIAERLIERLSGDATAVLRSRVRREHDWPALYRRHIRPLLAEVLAGRHDASVG